MLDKAAGLARQAVTSFCEYEHSVHTYVVCDWILFLRLCTGCVYIALRLLVVRCGCWLFAVMHTCVSACLACSSFLSHTRTHTHIYIQYVLIILCVCRSVPLVAVSVGCYGATLPDGAEFRGAYSATDAEILEFHVDRLRVRLYGSV